MFHRSCLSLRCGLLFLVLVAAGCATAPKQTPDSAARIRAELRARMPTDIADREGWINDVERAFSSLEVTPTVAHICAALAVTAQESGYEADPVVTGLARIAREEITRRAARYHVPRFALDAALKLKSSDGRSYDERLRQVRREGELSAIFEDLIERVPLGRRLFADANPVHTGGPMQVSIAFAETWAKHHPYPYATTASVRREVFTRRGGMYFGIARLLAWPVSYDRMIHRFADYNAGFHASRNAAFQNALNIASDSHLALDGDLVRYDGKPGDTEAVALALAPRLGLSERKIRSALRDGQELRFEDSALYRKTFELAERVAGKPLPRAMLPQIALQSPKITRQLTTAWFAERVDARYRACLR